MSNLQIKDRKYQHMRAIACMSVVAQPILGFFFSNAGFTGVNERIWFSLMTLVKFSAPIFIFYLGATVYKGEETYQQRLKNHTLGVTIQFLLWSIVYLIYLTDFRKLPKLGFGGIVKTILTGSAAPHLWYAVMLIQFHIFYPILLKFVKKITGTNKQDKSVVTGSIIAYFLLNIFLFKLFIGSDNYLVSLMDRWILVFFIYFLLGVIFEKHHDQIMKKLEEYKGLILGLAVALVVMISSRPLNVNLNYFHPLMFAYNLVAIAGLLVLCNISARNFRFFPAFLDYLSTMCFEVYLAAFMVFTVLRTNIVFKITTGSSYFLLILFYLTTLTFTVLLVGGVRSVWYKILPERCNKYEYWYH